MIRSYFNIYSFLQVIKICFSARLRVLQMSLYKCLLVTVFPVYEAIRFRITMDVQMLRILAQRTGER